MNTVPLPFLPTYFSKKSVTAFLLILLICSAFFIRKTLPFLWILFSLLEVFVFFFFTNRLTRRWSTVLEGIFEKKLFWTSFWIRIVWVVFSYFFFSWMTGKPFEFEAADSTGYHNEGAWLSGLLKDNKWDQYKTYIGKNYSDMGYPFYLGLIYYVIGENLLVPRLIKALLSSYICLFVYRITRNNFGESTGRIAGIMAMLLPNLIYYCGLHVKETEMVFLTVSFVYVADRLIRSRRLKLSDIVWLVLLTASLFFVRTVLATCLIGSLALAALFTSHRVSALGKRLGLLLILGAGFFYISTTPLSDNISEYLQGRNKNLARQMRSIAIYRNKGESNKLAMYGSRSIFLPLMLIAPFPTLVNIPDQPNAMMMAGAYFTRNAYAFFILIGLIALYKQKKLREHVLLLSVIFSYIFVLASSGFALSERFHLPLAPFLLMFSAYGISQMNQKNKKYYLPYLLLIGCIVIGWNWFKLAGRA